MVNYVLYVGGLSETASDYQLRELFGAYSTVVCANVVRYKQSAKSAGYGFVQLASREEALRAVAALDGQRFGDNRLRLFVTRSPDHRQGEMH